MTRAIDLGGDDDDDEEERFYESLDRLISSSSCSCSNSEDEADDTSPDPNSASDRPFPVPRFPAGVFRYDVWTSQPSSVSERRSRLLHEMGLTADPSLSQAKPGKESGRADFGRSVSADHVRGQQNGPSAGIVRSRSDGSVDHDASSSDQCNSNSLQPIRYSTSILSIDSNGSLVNSNNFVDGVDVESRGAGIGSAGASPLRLDNPPITQCCEKFHEIESDSTSVKVDSNDRHFAAEGNGVGDCDMQHNGTDDRANETVCTIKNLDNGKEFVVNEVREDGSWNKLKEVGTGRQLTYEEFEISVGHSPIVQELMRRQNVEEGNKDHMDVNGIVGGAGGSKLKKKGGWFRSIRSVASTMTGVNKERRSSDERDTSSEKGGRRSSSATDDSQDVSFHGPERVKVRQYGKSYKELTGLYKCQEIQAHNGFIWSIKFSLDGRYLASAGDDRVIHVWKVVESERKGELLMEKPEDGGFHMLSGANASPELSTLSPKIDNYLDKKRRGRSSISRKSLSLDHVFVPEAVFALSEKPECSFEGHLDDVLDLSWSKSQHLLSSSMDKTVRLWHLSSKSCLKVFSHSDYVTCIQFNPADDRYFISGSLDGKVRIWSVPDRQLVDWSDFHEMVTAACYTPDGQGALVGTHKGSCRLYNTSENKLQQKSQINLQNKKKKSHHKKITGFQFVSGSSSEVLITSADSRIRVVDGVDLVHKFKGFRNTNSQISASLSANGKYVVSASEDSHVYVWKHEADSRPSRGKAVTVTRSYEHFHCQDVSVAVPWPGLDDTWGTLDGYSAEQNELDTEEASTANHPPTPVEETNGPVGSRSASGCSNSPLHGSISWATNNFFDKIAATLTDEKLSLAARSRSPRVSVDVYNGIGENMSAWGLVIVTAGLRGEIRTFQNFGLPVRI
ncbi:uncharacterized protein LOC115665788 isoform X1 [Syzygium oleosum]|uniref:uncharacterized protein LOC115665788 isoform X1 n=1 Tax=Syzygium oleosum TaxID=219896 RepID=UPI0024BBBC45|nr:uncharacterized protein LOC115665788 isoform X1 [Syzygium oleosum]